MTETCGNAFAANPYDPAQNFTVGAPVAGMQMRLLSVPEMGYDALGSPARGELMLRSAAVFPAYHKRTDLTGEVKGMLVLLTFASCRSAAVNLTSE
jgi:long-chain acyl-CoA synthetase